jgi:hypothetical protein
MTRRDGNTVSSLKSRDLVALKAWGDRWAPGPDGPPLLFRHDTCGAVTDPIPVCPQCGEPMTPGDVTPVAGPGARGTPGTAEIPAALARIAAGEATTPLDLKRT